MTPQNIAKPRKIGRTCTGWFSPNLNRAKKFGSNIASISHRKTLENFNTGQSKNTLVIKKSTPNRYTNRQKVAPIMMKSCQLKWYGSQAMFNLGLKTIDIGKLIGQGSYSKVYMAKDLKLNKLVAVKILRKFDQRRKSLKSDIVSEIDILSQLSHKHCLKMLRILESDSSVYLICEYWGNSTFKDWLAVKEKNGEIETNFREILSIIE